MNFRPNILLYFITASLLLHTIVLSQRFPAFEKLTHWQKIITDKKTIIVSLNDPAIKKLIEDNKKRQIVNTENRGRNERDLNAKFLGEKDQKFDRQTKAKTIDSFREAGQGARNGNEKNIVAVASDNKSNPKPQSRIFKNGVHPLALSDLAFNKTFTDNDIKQIKQVSEARQGIAKGNIEKLGFSANNDYIEDVPLGDVTNLNTVEFKYYGFYYRIRQKLEQYWGRSLKEKADHLFKQGKRLPASSDKITSLAVIIDEKGNIKEVLVKSTSGVRELDDAAIESFNQAGPFPNPPKDMLVNGKATIEWGFVVKT